MASAELMRLYKLHEIDLALHRIKKQAGDVEEGKKLQAIALKAKSEFEAASKAFHDKHAEQRDLELASEQISDKIKSIEKQLFSGSVTNPKEIEALETQKKGLIANRSATDDKILPLLDEVPALQKRAAETKSAAEKAVKTFQDWKAHAEANRTKLEQQYKTVAAQRPEIVKTISATLLAKYEAIRAKYTIGIATISGRNCTECGSPVPEMVMTQLNDDKIVTCEGCQRILYHTGGVV